MESQETANRRSHAKRMREATKAGGMPTDTKHQAPSGLAP